MILPAKLTMRTLHTSYRVSNLSASLDFYTALGYTQVGRVDLGGGASLTMLNFPGEEVVTLELVHRPAAGAVTSAPGSVRFRSRSTISPPPLGGCPRQGSSPARWNDQVDRTDLRSHGSRTPTATGSNWCSGGRGTLTRSPRPTFSTNRGVSQETEIWSGGGDAI